MNNPVRFETAKLLKEKGFDFSEVEIRDSNTLKVVDNVKARLRYFETMEEANLIKLPTIAEVVMWLYEKHGIWVCVYTMDKWISNVNDKEQFFDYGIKQMKLGLIDIPKKPEEFNTPTEAYLEAINYTLKNLKI